MSSAHDLVPTAFVALRDLVRIHLKQMLKIPKKQPIHAATFLVIVACEALSRLLGRRDYDVFAKEFLSRRGVPCEVGRELFRAIRHGLAHTYTPYPVYVGAQPVWPILIWRGPTRGHLRIVRSLLVDGHQEIVRVDEGEGPLRLSLIVSVMVKDLDALFDEIEASLRDDAVLRTTVESNAKTFRQKEAPRPEREALAKWRTFLRDARWSNFGELR